MEMITGLASWHSFEGLNQAVCVQVYSTPRAEYLLAYMKPAINAGYCYYHQLFGHKDRTGIVLWSAAACRCHAWVRLLCSLQLEPGTNRNQTGSPETNMVS